MEYRVDLYTAAALFERTERFIARNEAEAVVTARGLVVGHNAGYALVYTADGNGSTGFVAKVGAER
ncbi:hypothetical protein ABZ749_00890 [Micromonospora sp. NPDC047753]|uniref:hypothetical protein n=1 Tax=Micromonospora sp. NPDC047753 TaxID=3154817 RepID=UPI0033CE004E